MKKLTDGVVANRVNWSTVKAPLKNNLMDILDKTRPEDKRGNTAASSGEVYSMQESCNLLQSSYDELYDDDDEADETGIIASHDDAPSDNVDSPLDHSNSNSTANDLKDDFTLLSGDRSASNADCSEPFQLEDATALYTPDVWNLYYSRLKQIGRTMRDREGWPNFDAVFMISAVDGDGVFDIKVNHFLIFHVLQI